MGRTYGAKYDAKLDTAEIAKRVRADITAAVKDGRLPTGLRTSVRMSRYAGGSSIHLKVVAVPFRVLNTARILHDLERPYEPMTHDEGWLHNERARELLQNLETLLNAYNHDGSQLETDYFDVKFYSHMEFAGEVTHTERQEVEAEMCGVMGLTAFIRALQSDDVDELALRRMKRAIG